MTIPTLLLSKDTNMKKLLVLILPICILISLASCGRRYPSYFTGEYAEEHYELLDMNLVYLKSYRKRTTGISYSGINCRFTEIKNVPLTQFIGMTSCLFLEAGHQAYVLSSTEFSSNPINDFEIKKIELYAKYDYFERFNSDLDKYGKMIYVKQLYEIENLEVIQEILESIRHAERENIMSTNTPPCESGTVTVRIHFKEYKNIVWDAEVEEKDGKYYLKLILVDEERKIFSLDVNIAYVYVDPNFDALMESLLDS